jgi:hypothetical protein
MREVEGEYADANQSVISLLAYFIIVADVEQPLVVAIAQVNTSLLVKVLPSVRQRCLKQCLLLNRCRPPLTGHRHQLPRCCRPPPWFVSDLWARMVDRFRSEKKKEKMKWGREWLVRYGKNIIYTESREVVFIAVNHLLR